MLGTLTTARLTVAGIVRALPWFIAGLALAFAAFQQFRISGFGVHLPLVGFVGIEGKQAKIDRLESEIQAMIAAQTTAADMQQAVNDAMQEQFDKIAERIDENAKVQLVAARAATDSFIARNRVQPCPATPTSGTDQAASAGNAGSAENETGLPELAGVFVSERDVRICTDNTVRALAGHKLATELESAGD